MDPFDFRIRYWGTTGTFARPLTPASAVMKLSRAVAELDNQNVLSSLAGLSPELREQKLREVLPLWLSTGYGGNTTCVEIQTPDSLIILDAGSGFRELGIDLTRRWSRQDFKGQRTAHVLLTHAHMDHTFATPLFDPFFSPGNRFYVSGPEPAIESLNTVLGPDSPLRAVYVPVTLDEMKSVKDFHVVEADQTFQIGDTEVSTLALNHPGGCLAYRLRRGQHSVVFATDHEHTEVPERSLVDFAHEADLLYTDAQYTVDEYLGRAGIDGGPPLSRVGWGHSTVDDAVATGVKAKVRNLHLGHHEPKRSDQDLATLDDHARKLSQQLLKQQQRPTDACQACLAYEGLSIEF